MLRLLLFTAFLVVPVTEIWLLIRVGEVIGGWQTVGLLIAAGILGSWLVRREGRRAWQAVQNALAAGRVPDRELVDGALVVAGGTLLVTPGFLSDVFGLFFVLPVTRPAARRLVTWFFARRLRSLAARSPYAPLFDAGLGGPGFPGPGFGAGAPGGDRPRGRVVHGEVIRDDEPGEPGTPPAYPAKPAQGG
jgi:Protein affecting phage T7 exclusion by the F plasmid